MNGDAASHGGEDTTNIVGAEVVGVERTREVANPEIRHDLVHRHGSPRCSRAGRDKVLCAIDLCWDRVVRSRLYFKCRRMRAERERKREGGRMRWKRREENTGRGSKVNAVIEICRPMGV